MMEHTFPSYPTYKTQTPYSTRSKRRSVLPDADNPFVPLPTTTAAAAPKKAVESRGAVPQDSGQKPDGPEPPMPPPPPVPEPIQDLTTTETTVHTSTVKNYEFTGTTTSRPQRTTPVRLSFTEGCDYSAKYCLLAYKTGKLCGRTRYNTYKTFSSYCSFEYINCMERYDMWSVAYMGECYKMAEIGETYQHFPYLDDYFMDQANAMEE